VKVIMRTLENSGSVSDVIEDRFGRDISAFRPRGYRLKLRGICSGIESEKDALETEVLDLVGCPRTDV